MFVKKEVVEGKTFSRMLTLTQVLNDFFGVASRDVPKNVQAYSPSYRTYIKKRREER